MFKELVILMKCHFEWFNPVQICKNNRGKQWFQAVKDSQNSISTIFSEMSIA